MTAFIDNYELKSWPMNLFGCLLAAIGLGTSLTGGGPAGLLISFAGLVLILESFGYTEEYLTAHICDQHLVEARDQIDAELAKRTDRMITQVEDITAWPTREAAARTGAMTADGIWIGKNPNQSS